MHTWNVYKVFKNGKRAKAPLTNFECEHGEMSDAITYFNAIVKENFTEKIRGSTFEIVREDASQERIVVEDKQFQARRRVLARAIREKNLGNKKRNLVGGLLFSKQTNWNWQWCALEAATSQFVVGLSPAYDTADEADRWMLEQMKNLP